MADANAGLSAQYRAQSPHGAAACGTGQMRMRCAQLHFNATVTGQFVGGPMPLPQLVSSDGPLHKVARAFNA